MGSFGFRRKSFQKIFFGQNQLLSEQPRWVVCWPQAKTERRITLIGKYFFFVKQANSQSLNRPRRSPAEVESLNEANEHGQRHNLDYQN